METKPLAVLAIGPRVKALRKLKGMTVEELAGVVAVNKAHISRIERNLKAPSIATMAKLADALGVTIGHLMGETADRNEIKITRGDALAARLDAGEESVHQYLPLLHGSSVNAFEAFLLYPGPDGGDAHAQHSGQEMLFVLAGTIEILFSTRTETLSAGDCIHFPGYLPHSITRVGRAKAKALLVLSAG